MATLPSQQVFVDPGHIIIFSIHPDINSIFHCRDREPGQLFSESYFNVAVMFASLPNYIAFFSERDDKKPLTILHEIISKFDQVTTGLTMKLTGSACKMTLRKDYSIYSYFHKETFRLSDKV